MSRWRKKIRIKSYLLVEAGNEANSGLLASFLTKTSGILVVFTIIRVCKGLNLYKFVLIFDFIISCCILTTVIGYYYNSRGFLNQSCNLRLV